MQLQHRPILGQADLSVQAWAYIALVIIDMHERPETALSIDVVKTVDPNMKHMKIQAFGDKEIFMEGNEKKI